MSASTLVAVDVGNSAVKVAVARSCDHANAPVAPEVSSTQTVSLDQSDWCDTVLQAVRGQIQQDSASTTVSWWVSTVNRAASEPLRVRTEAAFATSGIDFQWRAVDHRDVPLVVDVDAPDRVGIDRLVGAYAAVRRYRAPLVVVDVGSAVTVDWVVPTDTAPTDTAPTDRRAARFCGGAIFPGLGLQTRVLSSGTEGLRQPASGHASPGRETPGQKPAAVQDAASWTPGRNTADAIRLGVIASVVGAIERLADQYGGSTLAPPCVVISGGDGSQVSRHLRIEHVFVPHLVCQGLLDLATKRCPDTASGLK